LIMLSVPREELRAVSVLTYSFLLFINLGEALVGCDVS
jgi:hypothetical protein